MREREREMTMDERIEELLLMIEGWQNIWIAGREKEQWSFFSLGFLGWRPVERKSECLKEREEDEVRESEKWMKKLRRHTPKESGILCVGQCIKLPPVQILSGQSGIVPRFSDSLSFYFLSLSLSLFHHWIDFVARKEKRRKVTLWQPGSNHLSSTPILPLLPSFLPFYFSSSIFLLSFSPPSFPDRFDDYERVETLSLSLSLCLASSLGYTEGWCVYVWCHGSLSFISRSPFFPTQPVLSLLVCMSLLAAATVATRRRRRRRRLKPFLSSFLRFPFRPFYLPFFALIKKKGERGVNLIPSLLSLFSFFSFQFLSLTIFFSTSPPPPLNKFFQVYLFLLPFSPAFLWFRFPSLLPFSSLTNPSSRFFKSWEVEIRSVIHSLPSPHPNESTLLPFSLHQHKKSQVSSFPLPSFTPFTNSCCSFPFRIPWPST